MISGSRLSLGMVTVGQCLDCSFTAKIRGASFKSSPHSTTTKAEIKDGLLESIATAICEKAEHLVGEEERH